LRGSFGRAGAFNQFPAASSADGGRRWLAISVSRGNAAGERPTRRFNKVSVFVKRGAGTSWRWKMTLVEKTSRRKDLGKRSRLARELNALIDEFQLTLRIRGRAGGQRSRDGGERNSTVETRTNESGLVEEEVSAGHATCGCRAGFATENAVSQGRARRLTCGRRAVA